MPGITEGKPPDPLALLDAPTARLDALLPREDVWLDLVGSVSAHEGAAGRLELGAQHAFENGLKLGGFVAGVVTSQDARAEAGLRLTF